MENEKALQKANPGVLDSCHPGVATSALGLFGQHLEGTLQHTYIASLSSHVSPDEDRHGRLSMWRGFGGECCRVALVFNVPHPSLFSPQAQVFLSPVAYFNQTRVSRELDLVIEDIKVEQKFLSEKVKPDQLFGVVFMMLLSAVVSLKHEGFQEEREWRIIHSFKTLPTQIPGLLNMETRVIHGALQRILLLPLDKEKAPAMERLDFSRVLERIIIGPTQYAITQRDAFVELLTARGVPNPAAKVVYSDIPLRSRS